jgi:hypothetical protein
LRDLFHIYLNQQFITSTISSLNYDYSHVPLCGNVQTLNSNQGRLYNQQIQLFRKIYGYNSNAYVNYQCGVTSAPMYYTYKDQTETDTDEISTSISD